MTDKQQKHIEDIRQYIASTPDFDSGGMYQLCPHDHHLRFLLALVDQQAQLIADSECCHDPETTCMIRAHNRALIEKVEQLNGIIQAVVDDTYRNGRLLPSDSSLIAAWKVTNGKQ